MVENFFESTFQDRDLRGDSDNWANLMSALTLTTCRPCSDNHGKIVDISILNGKDERDVIVHMRCKCKYVPMRTKAAGTATDMGGLGADMYLSLYGELPNYYTKKEEAQRDRKNFIF